MLCMAVGDIGKRVKLARETMPGVVRRADLARLLQISNQRLNNWEQGAHDPPHDMLARIAEVTDVSIEWLVGETVPMRHDHPSQKRVERAGVKHIPIYGAISAGHPSCSDSDVIEWVAMVDWGGDFHRWGRVIDGVSMIEDLQPGMFAIFEDRRPEVGQIVHAFDKGEDTVKQYRRTLDGHPLLVPTNPEYDIIDGRSWNIKGVCIAIMYKDEDGARVTKEYPYGMRPKLQRNIL